MQVWFFRIVYENETPFLGLFCSAKYVTKVDFSHSNGGSEERQSPKRPLGIRVYPQKDH